MDGIAAALDTKSLTSGNYAKTRSLRKKLTILTMTKMKTRGRFHQSLCAKRKVAGAQYFAKILPFSFTNFETAEFCRIIVLNIANILRHSPQKASHLVRAKKSGKNVGEIYP